VIAGRLRLSGVGWVVLLAVAIMLAAGCAAAPPATPTPPATGEPAVAVATAVPAPTVVPPPTAPPPTATAAPTQAPSPTTAPTEAPTATVAILAPVASPASTQEASYAMIATSDGREVRVDLEVADTPQSRAVGLSRRQSLPEQAGMLFVWPAEQHGAFWMKDTYIPLSIAFISDDGRIMEIQDMEPLSEELHIPARPYRYALEVNQGFFDRNGIAAGDRAELQFGG
jgi:uncharacterized protein